MSFIKVDSDATTFSPDTAATTPYDAFSPEYDMQFHDRLVKSIHIDVYRKAHTVYYKLHISDNEYLPSYLTNGITKNTYSSLNISNAIGQQTNYIDQLYHESSDDRNSIISRYISDVTNIDNYVDTTTLMPQIGTTQNEKYQEDSTEQSCAKHDTKRGRTRNEFEFDTNEIELNEPYTKRRKLDHNNTDNKLCKKEAKKETEAEDCHWSQRFLEKKQHQFAVIMDQTEHRHDIEYEIDSIKARIETEEETHYLVHWKGFPLSKSSWEPISSLVNASEAIQDFEKACETCDVCEKHKGYKVVPCWEHGEYRENLVSFMDLRKYNIEYKV